MRHLFCGTRMIIEINICDRKLYRRPSSLYLNTQQRNYEVKYFRRHQKKKINTARRDGVIISTKTDEYFQIIKKTNFGPRLVDGA